MDIFNDFFPTTQSVPGQLHPLKTDCGHYHNSDTHHNVMDFRARMFRRVVMISPGFEAQRQEMQAVLRKLFENEDGNESINRLH